LRKARIIASLSALLAVAFPAAAHSDPAPVTLYFRTPNTAANVDHSAGIAASIVGQSVPSPSMDPAPPSKATPSAAAITVRNGSVREGIYQPTWTAALHGNLSGDADVVFWASAPPAGSLKVSLYADPAGTAVPMAEVAVAVAADPAPHKYTAHFTGLSAAVKSALTVQISVNTVTPAATGPSEVTVLFDSTDYPSAFSGTFDAIPADEAPAPTGTSFLNYPAPDSIGGAHGPNETSLGVNPATNAAMFLMSNSTAKATWDDTVTPPKVTWEDVSYVSTSIATLDPYLHVDRATGRTYVLQLLGSHSVSAFSDDDGKTWQDGAPPSSAPSVDHESLGAGPYAASDIPVPPNPYGRALYYCGQGRALSLRPPATDELFVADMGQCARSDDGGLTWGAPVPFDVLNYCAPSHGRVTVGNDGTVYLPVKDCSLDGQGQGIYVSRDNGLNWSISYVPQTAPGKSDPAIAVDKGNRLYYAASSDGTMKVATSTDSGANFSTPVDVGAPLGIKNTEFAMAVAGDAGRAAVAFYGSTTEGDDQDPAYTGEWHVYVSTTTDGGQTWTTVDATGSDPVQRGLICMGGLGCTAGRNLLDFQSIAIDNAGRVLVGYADGCTSAKCVAAVGQNNVDAGSNDSLGTIARQATGARLIAP
jgi:hypothetical protein